MTLAPRSNRRRAALPLLTLSLATGLGGASALANSTATSYVIRGDARIGAFAVKRDGKLGGMIKAYGQPDVKARRYAEACLVTWQDEGLRALFNNFGGGNPCLPRSGFFARAIMHGHWWRTASGLQIGDATARIRQFYPQARRHSGARGYWPSGWWLITRRSPFGSGNPSYPALLAETRNGRVISFEVTFPAGGD